MLGALGGVTRRLAGRGGDGLVQRRHERLAPSPRRPDPIDGTRPRARDHPGFRAAACRIVGVGTPPGLPEDLLEHIARVGPFADDSQDQREHHGRVAIVEAAEGLPVTGRHLPDEIRARRRHALLSLS